jgi:D-serine deaminase-like pyridoxal phosphate-dependent protein
LPEVEEGAYLRARGILPPNPGDPRPEEAIRRIRERIGTLAAASALAERVRALEAALRTIATFGQVCSEYDTCTHRACAASYSAWATATEALGKEGKGDD